MFFYANKDYTARIDDGGCCERYFIRFHGQVTEPEIEVTLEIFILYVKEFNKPMERWMNEQRRHIEYGGLDGFNQPGQLPAHVKSHEQQCVTKADLDAVLEMCTPIQQRRFRLYYCDGLTHEEIARAENCGKQRVKKSIDAVSEKIKKYFF